MRIKLYLCIILVILLMSPMQGVSAAQSAEVTNDTVSFNFPETATFSATLTANAEITSVTLEYGSKQQTCGDVIARAFPGFAPGKNVDVEWTWDMRQSGSLMPGSSIWWRWRYEDQTGAEYAGDTQNATWLDEQHNWQTITSDFLRLHWYDLNQATAEDLLEAGEESLARNEEQAGLKPDEPIDIYIYASYGDVQDAVLYEPSWMGGQADSESSIVIVGLSQYDHKYDRDVVIHELTHVLVGRFMFSCLSDVPSWIEEGLAVYSEGELDADSQIQLDQAIKANQLLSVRSLSSGFSEEFSKATLSYSESYSLVKFLIETYGQDQMTALLSELRDGNAIDDALVTVYGFDVEGLEDAWRDAIGAAPRPVSAQPTAQPTPTFVPTIVPVSGAPLAITPTPYVIPTSSFNSPDSPPSQTQPGGPPLALTIALVGFCCVLGLIFGVIIIGVIVRSQNRSGGTHDKL